MGLRVSTLIGRLYGQVVDTQMKKRKRRARTLAAAAAAAASAMLRKTKAVLRAEREAMNRDLLSDDPGTSLLDEILEDIFLRLPFFDLRSVEGVCRTWKRVIASQSFRRSYKSTATLVEANYRCIDSKFHEVRDSSNKALKFRSSINDTTHYMHRAITSHINGLVFAVTFNSLGEEKRIYVCDMFANTWVQVPLLEDFSFITDETAIFYMGGGQYKLVDWRLSIRTQTFGGGKQENWRWDFRNLPWCYTKPVIIGSSMFRVGFRDECLSLMEYNIHEADKLQSTPITGTPGEDFDLYNSARGELYLTVWQEKLYLLKQYLLNAKVDLWQISTPDGRATLLHRFRMKRQVESFDVFEVDEEGVLHLEGYVKNNGLFFVSLSYDMFGIGKCMQKMSVTNTRNRSRHTLLPVRLSNEFNT